MGQKALIISLLVAFGIASSALGASREGFGKGRIDPLYAGVGNAVPLLNTFYFRFGSASGSVDHHINSIMVEPAGAAVDVSPNADLRPPNVESGKITLMYQDKNGDDRYFYKVGHDTRGLSSARRFTIRDVGCRGKCERTLPAPLQPGTTFVLVGFKVFFTGARDHHVDEVAVFEDNRKLTVMLNDKNDDDVFGYAVDYAWVSLHEVRRTGEESGSARGGARVALPSGRKVIRGFHFDYASKDHHLREIGALTSNGDNLEVFYSDKNADDRFGWMVRWAIIGPAVLAPN